MTDQPSTAAPDAIDPGPTVKKLETIVSLAKRRGFVYPSSEIYGGINAVWDYGPLGVELKNNERVGLTITNSSVTANKVVVSGSKSDLIVQKGSSAVVVEKPDGTQTKPANKTEWVSTMPIPLPAPKWDFLKQTP